MSALAFGAAACAPASGARPAGPAPTTTRAHPPTTTTTTTPPAETALQLAQCASQAARASVGPVQNDTNLDQTWATYVQTNVGWTGGDSVFAYDVPGLGRLWTFADAYVGGLEPDGSRQEGIHHSLFVVQGPGGFRVVTHGEYGDQALVGPGFGNILFLSLGGTVAGDRFEELFTARKRWGVESIDTTPYENLVATFTLPGLRLVATKVVGGNPRAVVWGSDVRSFGGYTYVYGASALGFDKNAYVARVAGTDLNAKWSYWDGQGWTTDPSAAEPMFSGVGQEYSVTLYHGVYVLVTIDASKPFAPDAHVYFGCSPEGPFGYPHQFLVSFAVGPVAASYWHDPEVYVYDLQVQPALPAPPGDVIVSYDQNSLNFPSVLRHADIYRPGYLDVQLDVPAP